MSRRLVEYGLGLFDTEGADSIPDPLCVNHDCTKVESCRREYQLSVGLLDHQAAKARDYSPTFELWSSLPRKQKNHIAGGILFFEELRYEDACQGCFYFDEGTHLGMVLEEGFIRAAEKRGLPFDALGAPAFAILRRFLSATIIRPQEVLLSRFCYRAAKLMTKGKLDRHAEIVWRAVSDGCSCFLSYEQHPKRNNTARCRPEKIADMMAKNSVGSICGER